MQTNPLDAYQTVEKATLSGRTLEASVLNRAAARLAAVQQNWGAPDHEVELDEALRYNLRLWTLFQSELIAEGNPLPLEIKRNLLSLSSYIDRRTFDIMSFPSPAKLDILININTNIASGLLSEATEEAPAP
jgi:flagellar protein FlaF